MSGRGGNDQSLLTLAGELLNSTVSFLIFSFLDVLDMVLCVVYKLIDYAMEAEWKPCYCSSSNNMITSSDSFMVSVNRGPKVVRLCSTKLQLEDVSGTLYSRLSRVSEFSRKAAVAVAASTSMSVRSPATTSFAVSSNIMEMLKGKIERRRPQPIPLWSDCDCKICNSWSRPPSGTSQLYVHVEGPADGRTTTNEAVLFIHGFISSSTFWTETVFQEFTAETRSRHRLFAVDLLGFGRSPKPADSLYTLREHIDMIEKSVLERYDVRSFHIVAHSLGCIIALALAVRHPNAVKSLTLLAPPYFPVPRGEEPSQFIMRQVAPRKVWPAIAFGASMACWYEHVSRTICLLICKNHRLWDSLFKFFSGNRMRTFMIEVFMCHTHNAAWHTLHNVICASAEKMESYLETVREKLRCEVRVFHGDNDELLPVDCSYDLAARIPRARVKVFEKKDHVTIIVGQQRAFARELEQIWREAGK
ncbi:hypothetical protein OPV22_033159 [Ensete ventricosum]|uniref:AB hydrolase-1 domain-containing protein n=1 Tax=Ensete ventricosum TaxID=4639 RepID=A0AAV8Q0H8_ENSVE|nr:hypothetical protein OPV22_033159 [Ensete ventricosum]